MQTDPAPSTQPDLGSMLGDVRAAIAAEGPRKGLAGTVQEAFLKILEVLVALLLDFRAGRLAAGPLAAAGPDAGAARAEDAEDAPCAACAAPGEPGRPTLDSGCRGWWSAAWFRRHDWIPAEWVPEDWVPAFAGMTADAVTFAGMTARAVTFAGMTGKVEQYAAPSDSIAQSDRGSLSRNDEKIGSGDRAAMPPRERSSARLDREADRRANGARDGFLPEVRGANESHELDASPRSRRRGSVARRTQTTSVGCARWWVTPRVREACPPYARDGGAVRWSFLKTATWRARNGAAVLFQHKNDMAATGS